MRPLHAILASATLMCAPLPASADDATLIHCGSLIAIPNNPLEDISVLLDVHFVMARGHVVKD